MGDPWRVDESMRTGDPGAISDLGRPFFNAGACTAETYREFEAAQARFRATWDREDGAHPINDSAEVQRATTMLMAQQDQLPAIGADLSDIAANLAEAQRFSGMAVQNLNTQLEYIDASIVRALAHDQDTSALDYGDIECAASGRRAARRLLGPAAGVGDRVARRTRLRPGADRGCRWCRRTGSRAARAGRNGGPTGLPRTQPTTSDR